MFFSLKPSAPLGESTSKILLVRITPFGGVREQTQTRTHTHEHTKKENKQTNKQTHWHPIVLGEGYFEKPK